MVVIFPVLMFILNCRFWRIADETEVQRSRDTEEQRLGAVMSPGCGLGWSLVWRGGRTVTSEARTVQPPICRGTLHTYL